MAVKGPRRKSVGQAVGAEKEESDLDSISFSASHKTTATWQQLKRGMSLDNAQVAAFLLQWYKDTAHPQMCPHCQSALQHFCSTCSSIISTGRPEELGHSTSTTLSPHSSLAGKGSDQSSERHLDSPPTVHFKNTLDKEKTDPPHASVKTRNAAAACCNTTPRKRIVSVSSESSCGLDDVGEDYEMNDCPERKKEEGEDLADNVGECEESCLRVTEDGAKTEECESDREKCSAPWAGLETEREKVMTCRIEKITVISDNKASVDNAGCRVSTENEDEVKIDFKVEAQATDSKENTAHDVEELVKPDIASCMWCDLSFSSIKALTEHLTEHTMQSWQCQHLPHAQKNRTANSQQSGKNKDGSCESDAMARSTRSTRSQKRVDTNIETVVFEESRDRNSLSAADKGIFHCLQCGEGCKTPVGLTYHIQSAHIKESTYKCLHCSRTFSSLRGISFHMRTHPVKSKRERDPVTHPHQCGRCGRRFMHAGNLANHMEKHIGPSQFWCSQCQCAFQSMTDLTGHQCQPTDQKNWDPGHSSSSQATATSLSNTGKDSSEDGKPAMEADCPLSESVKNTSGRQEQEREACEERGDSSCQSRKPAKRGRKRNAVWMTMKEVKRPYKCAECQASFMYASVLKLHSQKHSGQKAFPCFQCQQSFTSKTGLYRHQEQDHWGSSPIICQDCGKVFATARSLDEHRVLHTGERPYPCLICGETFPYRTALTRHRRTHRASYFKCTDCGAEFHLRSEFNRHMNEHRAIKPHLCSHCGQSFSSLTMLKQHADKHTQKQFVCELCGKAFRKRGEHTMHLRTHQKVKPFPCPLCDRSFVSRSKLQLHNTISHLRLRPHTCQQCGAGFITATNLKEHISYVHSTERPFACSLCTSRFACKRFLRLHLRRTHKKTVKSYSLCGEGDTNELSMVT